MHQFLALLLRFQLLLLVSCLTETTETSAATIHSNYTHIIHVTLTAQERGAIGLTDSGPITLIVRCETTTGSPHVGNIQSSIDKLMSLNPNTKCTQLNGGGSKCTKMSITKDANIGICGKLWEYLWCWQAAQAAQKVKDKCAWKGLAGGTAWYSTEPQSWIIVH